MAIFYNTAHLPEFHKSVITIGTFDGVHHGHKKILTELVKSTEKIQGESIVITFEPHPRKLLFPQQPLKLLTPLEQKLDLLTEIGITHVVVAPFTLEFSNLSARDYIENFLVKYFNPQRIIIGHDHHFGHDRKGDLAMLRSLESSFGYKVEEIPAQLIEEAAVSSTKIRKALLEGRVEEGGLMLGREYSISGTVREGKQLGRTLGFPTANIQPSDPDQLIPGPGVYAVRVNWKNHLHNAMLNIGFRPTVSDEQKLTLEVNLFDFNQNIYGETLELIFIARIRDEQKFPSLENLKQQLNQDKEQALKILFSKI
jgi:riboflavin kinase / FMN adenylyltransferase